MAMAKQEITGWFAFHYKTVGVLSIKPVITEDSVGSKNFKTLLT